eukprot:5054613-Karenia_brevis.AAC.1
MGIHSSAFFPGALGSGASAGPVLSCEGGASRIPFIPKLQRTAYLALVAADPSIPSLIPLICSRMSQHYPEVAGRVREVDWEAFFGRVSFLGKHVVWVLVKTLLGAWRTTTRLGREDCGCIFGCGRGHGGRDSMRHYFVDCHPLWRAISDGFPPFRASLCPLELLGVSPVSEAQIYGVAL